MKDFFDKYHTAIDLLLNDYISKHKLEVFEMKYFLENMGFSKTQIIAIFCRVLEEVIFFDKDNRKTALIKEFKDFINKEAQ